MSITKFKYTPSVSDAPTDLTWTYGKKTYNICSRSQVLFIGGDRGSYKSTFCRGLVASALNSEGYMGYKYSPNGKKIIWMETEQSAPFFNRNLRDLLEMSNLTEFPNNFEAYCLNTIADPIEKRDFILNYINQNCDDIDILVIDGIGDIAAEESDKQEANLIMGSLSALVDKHNVMAIITSHTSDSGKLLDVLGRKLGRKARVGFILMKSMGNIIVIPDKTSWENLPVAEFFVNDNRQLILGDYIPFPIFIKQNIY